MQLPICKAFAPGNPANNRVVWVDGLGEFWFSYETLIAFHRSEAKEVYISPNDWGATTGKHIKAVGADVDKGHIHVPCATRSDFEMHYQATFKHGPRPLDAGGISLEVELTFADDPKSEPKTFPAVAGLRRFEKKQGKWAHTDHLLWVPEVTNSFAGEKGMMLVIPQDKFAEEGKLPVWNRSIDMKMVASGLANSIDGWLEVEPAQADHELVRRMLKYAKPGKS